VLAAKRNANGQAQCQRPTTAAGTDMRCSSFILQHFTIAHALSSSCTLLSMPCSNTAWHEASCEVFRSGLRLQLFRSCMLLRCLNVVNRRQLVVARVEDLPQSVMQSIF
jgi:hypothetical protein